MYTHTYNMVIFYTIQFLFLNIYKPVIPCAVKSSLFLSLILRAYSTDKWYTLLQIPSTESLTVLAICGWHCDYNNIIEN